MVDEIISLKTELQHVLKKNEELAKCIEELKAVHEKDKQEKEWLRKECDSLRVDVRILDSQMDVVHLIFGRK